MIYLQNDTPASPKLTPALFWHADSGADAAVVPSEDGIAQFRGDWVFVSHII
jgi:hypothetical protein